MFFPVKLIAPLALVFCFMTAGSAQAVNSAASLQLQRSHVRPGMAQRLASLEQKYGGRLGVAVIDTGSGQQMGWRMDERFPLCSTSKVMAVAALLKRSVQQPELMTSVRKMTRDKLTNYNPITGQHLEESMTLSELSAAALQYSDNAAMNLILETLGGPAAVTRYARSLGDNAFRLDRTEPTLNTAIPGDPRDTSTPRAQARSLQKLTLGHALPDKQRQWLNDWLRGNTTGNASIRAGLPADWTVGDKTGSGDYGTTNDIAVAWPQGHAPIVIAVYYTQNHPKAESRREVLAEAARIVAGRYADDVR